MSHHTGALALAAAQVAAVRDDPAARLSLMARVFHGPTGHAPRHLPFRRAALSFMRWRARRGVLNALDASPPGSVWWRAVTERLLRDGCETVALLDGLGRRAVIAGRARAASYSRASPASAAPVSRTSSPKPSTGPSAPLPCSASAAAACAPQASMPAVKS